MILYNHQLKNYKWNIETKRSHHKNKEGKYKTDKYLQNIITFDIECSSAWLENGKVISYYKGMDNDYWNSLEPLALCYIWQCSIDDTVYYGRELNTFTALLDDLPKDVHIIIWIHNLAYEFQFLCNILTWDKVFARLPHKPMKASCKEYPYNSYPWWHHYSKLSVCHR